MIEIYYAEPADIFREELISEIVRQFDGSITCREEPEPDDIGRAVCLTAEFESYESAERAFDSLQARGEHVEGPCDY